MNQSLISDEKIEFPPFENFQIDSINHFKKGTPKIFDLNNEEFNYDEAFQIINDFISEQLSNEDLIYFPQSYLNIAAFSPRANEIYENVKEQLIDFGHKRADDIINLNSITEISNQWNYINKIHQNISHYFNIFTLEKDSFSTILYSLFNEIFSEKSDLIQLLHSSIIDSFNNGIIQWLAVDCSDLLIKCNIFDSMFIIDNFNVKLDNMENLDLFFQVFHSLVPSDQVFHFLDYLIEQIQDFVPYFAEVPQNWKYISSLYEIYDYKGCIDDFISKFTELVKSKFTAFNPFQIFDEIHSLGSTNLMFVIRNIASTLFNSQNDMFSILLANYIHTTFISLKQPISNDRLFLFDEFAQLSNGFFVRYHSHNLLKRLLNYKNVVFDADERFSKICGQHHISAIIDDFKRKQKIICEFPNESQILNILIFNHEFFADQPVSSPKFPNFLMSNIKLFQNFYNERYKSIKLTWNFALMQVKMKVLNIPQLKCVKCNGIAAIILIKLSQKVKTDQKSMKIEDLCKELDLGEQDASNSIETLNTFSLIKINNDHSISLNENPKDIIDECIIIPSIPKFVGVPNQTMVNTIQIESMITRYVKLHPGYTKEEVFQQLSSFSSFTFTEQEFYNSLRSLIKKQIISPLDSSKSLKLTYP